MSDTTTYKFRHFDVEGRAEMAAMLFALGKQEFEHIRVPVEEWPALKPNTPFGQLPTLEVDGTVICQTKAIYRFLGNKFGYSGKTPLDAAKVDMIVDSFGDLMKPLLECFKEKDPSKRAAFREKCEEEDIPFFLGHFEAFLKQNNEGKGFFVGDDITWVDLYYLDLHRWFAKGELKVDWEKTPVLAALKDRILADARVAEYMAKKSQKS